MGRTISLVLLLWLAPALGAAQSGAQGGGDAKPALEKPAAEKGDAKKPDAKPEAKKPEAKKPEAKKPEGAAKLRELLRELASLPPAAWEARLAQIRNRIAQHQSRASALRKQAEELRAKVEAEERSIARLTRETERLASIMKLVGTGRVRKDAAKQPAKDPAKDTAKNAAKDAAKPKAMKDTSGGGTPAAPATGKPAAGGAAAKADGTAAALIDYERHMVPIFEERCIACHEAGDASGGLDLSSYAATMQGGGSGKTLVKGDPDASRLYRLVARLERPYMPRDGDALPAIEVERIKRWIALGAPENAAAAKAAAAELEAKAKAKKNAAKNETVRVFEGPPTVPKSLPAVALASVVQPPPLRALAVSPRAAVAAVSGHRQVLLYDTETLERLGVLPFAHGEIEVLRFSDDGAQLLVAGGVAGSGGRAVLFDVVTGAEKATFGPERDTVLAAAISPRATLVALAGPGRAVHVYSAATSKRVYEVPQHRDFVLALDFSPDGNFLASADRAGEILVTEADTGRNVHELRGHNGPVHRVRFTPDAKLIVSAGDDSTLRSFRIANGRQVASRNAHGGATLAVAVSAQGQIVTGGRDGRVRMWKPNGQPDGDLPAPGEWVYCVGFTHDGGRVLAGDWRGRMHVYEVRTKKRVRVIVPALAESAIAARE